MSKHTMRDAIPFGYDEIPVDIKFTYSPGRPAVMYLRNGDPGYPADPPEIDLVSVHLEIDDPKLNKMATDWAIEYLASDEGFARAVEVATDNNEYDRELAAEARAELAAEDRMNEENF